MRTNCPSSSKARRYGPGYPGRSARISASRAGASPTSPTRRAQMAEARRVAQGRGAASTGHPTSHGQRSRSPDPRAPGTLRRRPPHAERCPPPSPFWPSRRWRGPCEARADGSSRTARCAASSSRRARSPVSSPNSARFARRQRAARAGRGVRSCCAMWVSTCRNSRFGQPWREPAPAPGLLRRQRFRTGVRISPPTGRRIHRLRSGNQRPLRGSRLVPLFLQVPATS